jgi:hypothetical protein
VKIFKFLKMKENDNIIRIYTGTELTANLLKDELEKIGIIGIIQNDFESGTSAGIAGDPSAIDLFIQESDLKKARPIIVDFLKINKG